MLLESIAPSRLAAGVGFALADNAMDLHIARLTTWNAAWVLDQGGLG
jgi:hypothetical protein